MVTLRRNRPRRAGEGGFTLIELLVVIVILGILSAVVVFAVRGAGDKGETEARATDERIIRTAMETFCAVYGRYPADMDELVNGPSDGAGGRTGKGFISGTPTYHTTIPPAPATGCGGLSSGNQPENPKCRQRNQDGDVVEVAPGPGKWCLAASPFKGASPINAKNMVRLADGRIFTGMEVYDPAGGTNGEGSWTKAPLNALATEREESYDCAAGQGSICGSQSPATMLTIEGSKDLCEDNCGKVLAFTASLDQNTGGQWELYDPSTVDINAGTIGKWTPLGNNLSGSHIFTRAVQIMGDPDGCGGHCGKVLMIHSPQVGDAQLWDPKTEEFIEVPALIGASPYSMLQAMPNGQVFVVTYNSSHVFDPRILSFVYTPNPTPEKTEPGGFTVGRWGFYDETEVLPNGSVVMTSHLEETCIGTCRPPCPSGTESCNRSTSRSTRLNLEIFTPTSVGLGGTWSKLPPCGVVTEEPNPPPASVRAPNWFESQCHLLSPLSGGRILAWSGSDMPPVSGSQGYPFERGPSYRGKTYILDPGTKTWTPTGDLNTRHETYITPGDPGFMDMPSGGILISGGNCAPNCGKVLVVNRLRANAPAHELVAELYTPPAP